MIGRLATGLAVSSILDGTFVCPAEIDHYTALFIKQLAAPHEIREAKPIPIAIPAATHRRG